LIKLVQKGGNNLGKYLTCEDIATLYGVKKSTVWQWIRDKKLNAIQTGNLYRVRPEDLREFEEARKTKNVK
jgi:excisionase family DNA binding protein